MTQQFYFCCCVALVVSNSVRPHRWQPTRLPRTWDSPGKNTGVGCHCLLQCMKVKSESEVAQSCPTLATPWTAAYQAPLSMGFSRQKYWSGVPLPSPMLILGPVNETPPTCETSFSLSGYCLNSENAIEPEEHGASRWKGPGSLNGCMKHRTPSYLLPTCIGL